MNKLDKKFPYIKISDKEPACQCEDEEMLGSKNPWRTWQITRYSYLENLEQRTWWSYSHRDYLKSGSGLK